MSVRRWVWVVLASTAALAGLVVFVPGTPRGQAANEPVPPTLDRERVTLRLRVGLRDTQATDWSGSVKVAPGQVVSLEGWRFAQDDAVDGTSWKARTRRLPPQSSAQRRQGAQNMPMGDNGVLIALAGTTGESQVEITTAQGNLTFALSSVAPGQPQRFLQGAAVVDGVAPTQTLVETPGEEDYPAAAVARDGTLYVAYSAFTHGAGFAARPPLTEEPKDFSPLANSTGGDRIWLTALKGNEWSRPIAVTDGGGDLYRPAVAVDDQGRAWVFYSGNEGAGKELTGGDWEILARRYENGRLSPPLRLTREAGADVYAAATTDADGRVWVVWQAFRGGNSRILAARQEGDGFGRPFTVADTPANEWCPAIAATAAAPAEVAIAWDTYAKGDYDVYLATWRGGRLSAPRPAAATLNYEVRPSLAYDGGRRIWIAWEQSGEKWGKDFGPLAPASEKKGIALYQGRQVGIRVLENGKWYEPAGDLAAAFAGQAGPGGGGRGQGGAARPAAQRNAGGAPSYPRLGTDRAGRVWLAARLRTPQWRTGVGTSWFEYVTYPRGGEWSPPVFVPNSDNLLDNRPALLADSGGGMLLVGSSDGRQKQGRPPGRRLAAADALPTADPVNNDLYAVPFAAAVGEAPQLHPAAAPVVAQARVGTEPRDVARVRDYRTRLGGSTLRVLRGEFHRHTEISQDGGGDGSLEEMWRYGLDAAAMDWIGNGDHDNGGGREYPWWITQKTTDIFLVPGAFTPMFTYERSVSYPDGHRNVVFAQRGVRTLQRLQGGQGRAMDDNPQAPRPNSPDTQALYHYLLAFDGICASHTSGTDMGTDWRDNHRQAEPIVEVYQGDRNNYERPEAPRSATGPGDSLGGWRPLGFVNLALQKGYRLGFQCSSDHVSTHISYCNVFVEQPTRRQIYDAMAKRRIYGSTDNIVADVRWTAGGAEHFMGEEFAGTKAPTARVKLWGTAPFAKVFIVKNDRYVHSAAPGKANVDFTWTDAEPTTGTSYYYVRGEQADGELVWVSPVWVTYQGG